MERPVSGLLDRQQVECGAVGSESACNNTLNGLPGLNGYPSAAGPVQTSESSPVIDRRSTTEPPNQLKLILSRTKLN